MPNYLLEELKDLPDAELSFHQQVYKMLHGKYTGLGMNPQPIVDSVKNELTMNINVTLAILQDEIQFAVEEGIGNLPDWTKVNVFKKLLRIVALASGRIFVGRPLSRDEDWIEMTINYTVDSFKAIKDVRNISPWLRPFLTRFTPSIRRSIDYRRRVAEKLRPQLEEMIEASKHIKRDDEDDHVDVLPSDQHNLATWLLVSAV